MGSWSMQLYIEDKVSLQCVVDLLLMAAGLAILYIIYIAIV